MNSTKYSLRERKHARTKLALMSAFIERLRKARFEHISIRAVCKSVEVSESTFFNYFPEKIDVITYYINLMTLKIVWKARQKSPRGQYIALLTAFFEEMADEFNNANIAYQLISIMLVQQEKPKTSFISDIEKRLFFPELAGIEHIGPLFIDEFFRDCLDRAQKNGECPGGVNIANAWVSLMAILVGTLIAVKFSAAGKYGGVKSVKYHYLRQLQRLWTELDVKNRKGQK